MKRFLLVIISVFALIAQTTALESQADFSEASISIKFYDRTIYYTSNAEDNPIYVHITISNKGNKTLRFNLADDRMFSADFQAFTVKNKNLELTEKIKEKRTTNQTVYFRQISLEKGEEYSFVENVKDYLVFTEPSIYYLELNFYPELYKLKDMYSIKSNRLTLEIRPSPSAASSNIIPVKNETVEILKPQTISPDQVVEQTIQARQKSLWDQYFLYFDLDALIQKDELRKRHYISASASDRENMISDYKALLMSSRIDTNIVAIPESYQIERTTYAETEGTVSVLEWFQNKGFKEKKRYTYYVRQRNGIWYIYDYSVYNLGTE